MKEKEDSLHYILHTKVSGILEIATTLFLPILSWEMKRLCVIEYVHMHLFSCG